MKCVIFLAICIVAVTGLPWRYMNYLPFNYNELAKITGKISISFKDKNGTWKRIIHFNKAAEETELINVPETDAAKFPVNGHINIGMKFSNVEETNLQNAISVNAEHGENARVSGSVYLEAKQVAELVEKELAKLGIKEGLSTMQVFEPIEMEDIEIMSASDLAQKDLADLSPEELAKLKLEGNIKANVNFANPIALKEVEGVNIADLPNAETAKWKIKIKMDIKININIRFSNLIDTEIALAQLDQKEGAVCIHVNNGAEDFHIAGVINTENASVMEIEDVEMVTAAESENMASQAVNKGGHIRIGIKTTG